MTKLASVLVPCRDRDRDRDRLIVALDVPTLEAARALTDTLGDSVNFYKIGLELLVDGGLDLAQQLKRDGRSVFLDMKFLDIGNTVEKAVANVARLGLDFLTVHGSDRKTLDAAVRGRGDNDLKLLAVTVLTSLDKADLVQQGITDMTPGELVLQRAKMAKAAGFDGVIASGNEAAAIRKAGGDSFLIVTPGIRLAGDDPKDQSRAMTPAKATENGADYLVVGRPITQAPDPKAAAERFEAEIRAAKTS